MHKTKARSKKEKSGKANELPVKVVNLKKLTTTEKKAKKIEAHIIKEEFIEDFEEKVDSLVEKHFEKEEKAKRLLMLSGVSFFMLLIVVFWLYNFKQTLRASSLSKSESILDSFQIDEIKEDFVKILDQAKINDNLSDTGLDDTPARVNTLPVNEEAASTSEIELLKNLLVDKIATSSIAE